MAIWDNKPEENIIIQSATSQKCLSCGGTIKFNTREGMLVCDACGNRYYPESFELNELLSERRELDIDSEEAKKRAEEDAYKIERVPKHEIICNSCGATVVTDVNTVSTFCAFCGSTAIVSDRLKKEFRPDYIVPFKLTKDDAIKKVKEFTATRRFLPRGYNSPETFKKITGIYVPFWLVDGECRMDVGGSATKISNGFEEYYDVRRKGVFHLCGVPFDGSKKISDKMMEAIEPFDYSDLVPFKDAYLEGMYAERYDLTPRDMSERIANRFRDYMYNMGADMIRHGGYAKTSIDDDRSISNKYKCNYALLPVWLLSYNYDGGTYRVAVNGQTGDIDGRVPESEAKRKWWKFGMYAKKLTLAYIIIGFFLALLVGLAGALEGLEFNPMVFGIFLAASYIALAACAVLHFNGKMISGDVFFDFIFKWLDSVNRSIDEEDSKINTTQEMPDVSEYLDRTEKVNIQKIESPSAAHAYTQMVAAGVRRDIPDENVNRRGGVYDRFLDMR